MMKKLLFALLILTTVSAMAQNDCKRSIQRITDDCGCTKPGHFKYTGGSFSLGFIGTTGTPDGMSTTMGRSLEFDLGLGGPAYKLARKHSIGVEFHLLWRNFRMTDRNYFYLKDNGNLAIQTRPDNVNPKFSRLHTFAISLPVMYEYRWTKDWKLIAGPEFAFNCLKDKRYYVKSKYIDADGSKQVVKQRGVHVNPVNVNVLASVMYKGLGLYVRYSPMDVLDDTYGPDFQSVSVGIRAGM